MNDMCVTEVMNPCCVHSGPCVSHRTMTACEVLLVSHDWCVNLPLERRAVSHAALLADSKYQESKQQTGKTRDKSRSACWSFLPSMQLSKLLFVRSHAAGSPIPSTHSDVYLLKLITWHLMSPIKRSLLYSVALIWCLSGLAASERQHFYLQMTVDAPDCLRCSVCSQFTCFIWV